MRILVTGANGFIGRNVCESLMNQGHEVVEGLYDSSKGTHRRIDLTMGQDVQRCIGNVRPDVIVNCAGVVGPGANFEDNVQITRNLIEAVAMNGLRLYRYVVCGSAGEYGRVDPKEWPVKESTELNGDSPYASSKVREERVALELANRYNIDLVIARIFNPIGSDMAPKFLIPSLVGQINDMINGKVDSITVNRLDSLRDYINIDDAAHAIALLATKDHKHEVYNIGSGVATSTREILKSILDTCGLSTNVEVREQSPNPENSVASQADITLVRDDFGWVPTKTIDQSIREIVERYYEKR